MAKGKKKPPTKFDEFSILAISLVDVNIDLGPLIDDKDQVSFSYHLAVETPELVTDDTYAFVTTANITKRKSDQDGEIGLTAIYYCAIRTAYVDADDLTSIAKACARTSVWGMFVSLSGLMIQQMSAIFPLLPPDPGVPSLDEKTQAPLGDED